MLIYIHGLNSSSRSSKAGLLRERMTALGRAADYVCPDLPHRPRRALERLEAVMTGARAPVALVGSSLGGYYATCLAERHRVRAVLVNPAVRPYEGLGAGFITRAQNTGIVEEYDPAKDQWGALKAPMPTPRNATAWGTHEGKIYVAGGEERFGAGSWQRTFRAVEAFDPKTNSWSTLPPMRYPRHGLAGDILDGKFHLVSGDVASGGGPGTKLHTNAHEVLDIDAR
jgi:pimeloyl-ACP methyl ester carboxylesterase